MSLTRTPRPIDQDDVIGANPLLSVVVTIVEGGRALRDVLQVLTSQDDAPPLEIIVPHDETVGDLRALREGFPAVQFIAMGRVPTELPAASAGGEHELFDRRRAVGLRAARGELIAIVEDRGLPTADWARTAVRLHAQLPHAVIGGAIDPSSGGPVAWAMHVCDYTRYSSPFVSGPRDWVSDVNVVYKRRALTKTQTLWQHRYQEPVVHWSLQEQGEVLYLSNELRVFHGRGRVAFSTLIRERFHWGRLFGSIRGRHMSPSRRVLLALASPLIPFAVLLRHARAQLAKGNAVRFLRATPLILALLVLWTAGEIAGVVTRRA